jgi:ribosomal protein L11 methyltransferase
VAPCRSVVQITVDAARAELAADALWQAEPTAVATTELSDGTVRLVADVADTARIPGGWEWQAVELDSDEYLDAWRSWAQPVVVDIADGPPVVLQPAWLPPADVAGDATIVRLDPGRTFGSGSHPSTQLAIQLLVPLAPASPRVLDVGCGSGVLAVAAVLRGAGEVEAIDVDAAAVVATGVNAQLNGVAGSVHASTTPLLDVGGRFDLVLANIGAGVLRDLASPLGRRVGPSGALVVSGILDEQVDDVLAAYAGWTERRRAIADGWTALCLGRQR